ncbi:hypothetical protein D9M69_628010 [compost metagenome]
MRFHAAHRHHAGGLRDELGKAVQVDVEVGQRIGAAVVHQDHHAERAAPQDAPHEVEAHLAGRAVQAQLLAVVEREFAVVQADRGGGLGDRGVAVAHIGAHGRDLAHAGDGRGFAGAHGAGEEDLVFYGH